MNAESAKLTDDIVLHEPAELKGFIRSWNVASTHMTVLGVIESTEDNINGVLIKPNCSMIKMDDREKRYNRIKVDKKKIKTRVPLHDSDNIYVYIPKEPITDHTLKPVLASYLDVVLQGCEEINPGQIGKFLASTEMPGAVLNDRKNPQYLRSLDYSLPNITSLTAQFDLILKSNSISLKDYN